MLQTNLIQNAHADLICDASYSFYGTRLATGGLDQRIKVWRLDEQSGEWSVEDEWKAHDAAISRLAWAHPQHGQLLASASFDRTVKIWERIGDVGTNPGSFSGVGSGAGASSDRWVERALLSEAKGSVRCVEWAPTAFGMKIATISSDNHLRVYECLESATATAPGGSGGSSTGLNAAGNPSSATPPDSVLGINMSTPGAPVTTPGPSQPWALTWSLIEDIDVSAMPLFTGLPATGGEPASPAPGQSVPLATTGLGGEFTTVSGFDTTIGVSATVGTAGPGPGSSSPFIGGKQVLSSATTTPTITNSGSGSNIAALGNTFGLTSQGAPGISSVVAPASGSPGNTVNSSFGAMLGSPPTTTSAFGGLGGGATGLANIPPIAGSSSAAVHTTSKVGNSTVSNREADGGWDLSWCKDPYWGEVCAAVAGGSGIIKIIQLQAGQRPRSVLFLDPRPSSSNGSGDTLNSRGVTPTSTPHLRAQQPGSQSQFLSPHHPTSAANHSKPASPKPSSSLATTSISWAPSCGRSYHLIAAGSRDGKVRIWKVRPPPPKLLDGEDEEVTDSEAEEYEDQQRNGGNNNNNNNKNNWSASIVADFEDHASAVGKVAWNITGTVLTSAGNDGRVRLWKCTYGNVWRPMGSLDVIQSDDVIDGDRMEE